jgi:hypothetical protein
MQNVQERMKAVVAKTKKLVTQSQLPPKKIKTSGWVADQARSLVDAAKHHVANNKPALIGGAIGGTAGGLYGYLASKRHKKGKPSAMERDAKEMLIKHEISKEEMRRNKKKPGLGHKLHGVYGRAFADMAKTMKDHPVATGAMIGAAGASAGSSIGRYAADVLSDHL